MHCIIVMVAHTTMADCARVGYLRQQAIVVIVVPEGIVVDLGAVNDRGYQPLSDLTSWIQTIEKGQILLQMEC